MKKSFIAFLAVFICASVGFAQTKNKAKSKAKTKTKIVAVNATTSNMAGGVILKGAALNMETPLVALADVLKDPASYTGKKIRTEGVIERSCTKMGCWLEIAATPGGDTVRAETKHKFFIPLDAAGSKIKAEGEIMVKTISKEDADHFASEGAKLKRNADGTATEVAFVVTGVELSR